MSIFYGMVKGSAHSDIKKNSPMGNAKAFPQKANFTIPIEEG